MIKYAVPGMYEHARLYFCYLNYMKQYPQYFYDNIEIEVAYGNPQFCVWDGGRIFSSYTQSTREEILELLNTYNNVFNMPIRYVFTNCCLTESDYHNRFGHLLMELGAHGNNEVVVADDNFMHYLKTQYPSFKYISSTTKCLNTPDLARAELNKEDYSLVCLDYNLNHNLKFLESLSPAEIEKTELLVNAICNPGCQNRQRHYYKNSQSHLNYGQPYTMDYCNIDMLRGGTARPHHITYEDIVKIYAPMGLTHFKLEGRTWDDIDLLIMLNNYMVKPEYRNEVLSSIWANLQI